MQAINTYEGRIMFVLFLLNIQNLAQSLNTKWKLKIICFMRCTLEYDSWRSTDKREK